MKEFFSIIHTYPRVSVGLGVFIIIMVIIVLTADIIIAAIKRKE